MVHKIFYQVLLISTYFTMHSQPWQRENGFIIALPAGKYITKCGNLHK